ncbi:MAG: bifunctional UDP-N-acetylglucosamine diphosphorylase/glucosamine-1-phosphate N-acetyltransferase GlmU [Thermomicrobiales bacterium]|nr:bifunctional UDP-N-acetylglucosamine diphosphorylase/glucosamine-1-phosphate N-acetyltransferase GlmU [Thermomicrobiales bacterium]
MRSAVPKPLHPVAGVPMVERVLRAGAGSRPDVIALVVSSETAQIAAQSGRSAPITPVVQDPPRGTGDAVRLALDALPEIDRAVVLYSDHPLLEAETVAALLEGSRPPGVKVAILSARLPDAAGYGRVVRDGAGRVVRIAERRDDDPEQRKGETEINSGMMALDARWAREALRALRPSAASGELYLTDLVDLATREASPDGPWPVVAVAGSPDDAQGVNDRLDLARADARALARIRQRHMLAGVTMRLPETILIEDDVQIGVDTEILPHSQLTGRTVIGAECLIGPGAVIAASELGDRVVVRSSTVEDSRIGDDTDVGPYAHLRGGCEVGPRVHIGNFAELKNARLDAGVKVGHFSYLGDAALGAGVNIGAGTVTANFDGERKHRTEIGADAFIGSDTILRAPVRVGDRARTGAGSVVTKDVADGATVVGVPARVVRRAVVERGQEAGGR